MCSRTMGLEKFNKAQRKQNDNAVGDFILCCGLALTQILALSGLLTGEDRPRG